MSKLGYTWYPKDWGNSEAVFELNLSERGLYRELIDMAMLNDNTTECNYNVWSRKFNIDFDDILVLLDKIAELNLIEYVINEDENIKDTIFIPSCEPRLKLSRGGKNGGKKSRKSKPTPKPIVSLVENKDKPTPNQKKVKETKVNESDENPITKFTDWFNYRKNNYTGKPSNHKRLSYSDIKNLTDLKTLYSKEDFERVMSNMINDKYCNENNRIVPSHFLEHFDNYISIEAKPIITIEKRRRSGWAV